MVGRQVPLNSPAAWEEKEVNIYAIKEQLTNIPEAMQENSEIFKLRKRLQKAEKFGVAFYRDVTLLNLYCLALGGYEFQVPMLEAFIEDEVEDFGRQDLWLGIGEARLLLSYITRKAGDKRKAFGYVAILDKHDIQINLESGRYQTFLEEEDYFQSEIDSVLKDHKRYHAPVIADNLPGLMYYSELYPLYFREAPDDFQDYIYGKVDCLLKLLGDRLQA